MRRSGNLLDVAAPHAPATATVDPAPLSRRVGRRLEDVLYALTVVVGAVLIVITALNQPYNQNEWQQIAPYDEPDLGRAVSGTRQPPLAPLLGALVQRAVGVGQLEPRLVPVTCGIASLVLMVLLLRRLRLGYAGVAAMTFMAMAPVFLRISAYARPYALPMTLMLLCALAGSLWLDSGRRRWLVVTISAAVALPLSRVPEPTVFLAASALGLGIVGARRPDLRDRAWALGAALLVPLVTVGAYFSFTLNRQTQQTSTDSALLDLSPTNAVGRLPEGLREMRDHVLPLHAEWFPSWPLILVVLVLALTLRQPRRDLLRIWYWLPFTLAPLVFLVAYHTVNAFPLEMRHYQIRFAYFWVPPLAVLLAVLLAFLTRDASRTRRTVGVVLAAGVVLGQLPGTWRVLTENDAVDVAQAAEVVRDRVPADGTVIYDGPARAGWWRQPFFGRDRYLDGGPRVVTADALAQDKARIRRGSPVHLLILDSECVSSTGCDTPSRQWSGTVDGYEQTTGFDRFTLYSPTEGQIGPEGAIDALRSLVDAYGPEWAVTDAAAAARLLEERGRPEEADSLLRQVCAVHEDAAEDACTDELEELGMGHPLEPAG